MREKASGQLAPAGHKFLVLTASSAALLALTSPAFAQSAPALVEEEIVVTATKREQSVIEVPAAVTAIGGEQLNEQNLLRIEDFASRVPGFNFHNEGGGRARLIIRGQNTGGAGASVATMIDEVVLTSASGIAPSAQVTANIDTFDLERIEVLRGPQGTLFGATAQGGLLRYITRAPDPTGYSSSWQVGVDSVSNGGAGWSGRGMLNIPLSESAALRANFTYQDIAGYIDNPVSGEDDVNSSEEASLRLSLLWEPTDRLSLRLTGFRQEIEADSPSAVDIVGAVVANTETSASFELANGGEPARSLNIPVPMESSYEYYNFLASYDLGAASLISSTSRTSTELDEIDEVTYNPGIGGLAFFFPPPVAMAFRQGLSHEKFNQEVRLVSNEDANFAGVPFAWQFGVFYSQEDIRFTQYVDAVDPSAPSTPLTTSFFGGPLLPVGGSSLPAEYEEVSAFGDLTFRFNPSFEFSTGARFTTNSQWSQVTQDLGPIGAGPFATSPNVNPPTESEEDVFTFSVAPRWIINENASVYARVASGYRPGGPIWAIPGAPADVPVSYDADNTLNYEVGVKGRTRGGRATFDVALFRIDWTDIQVPTVFVSPTTNGTFGVTANAGTARSEGIEWSFALQPVEGLSLALSGALTNAQLEDDAPNLGGVQGDALPYVPDLSAALSIDYEWALSGDVVASVGTTLAYTGERSAGFSVTPFWSNHVELPSYSTIDARAGVEFGHFRVDLFGRNLSDETGLTQYLNFGGAGGTGQAFVIQPRTVGLRLTANY